MPTRALVLVCLLILALLTGCSESEDPAAGDGPRILQGKAPGEPAEEVPSGTVPENEWAHQDVMFMQMMIPHHGQALEMSELASSRAQDPRVRRLAERIASAQGPEIMVMAGWLADRGLEVPRAAEDPSSYDHGEHGHTAMAGMLSPAQMKELADARGAAFDRLFLTGMIAHHRGAVQMAQETAVGGTDVRVGELRDDVATSQTAEIRRMEKLLQAL